MAGDGESVTNSFSSIAGEGVKSPHLYLREPSEHNTAQMNALTSVNMASVHLYTHTIFAHTDREQRFSLLTNLLLISPPGLLFPLPGRSSLRHEYNVHLCCGALVSSLPPPCQNPLLC